MANHFSAAYSDKEPFHPDAQSCLLAALLKNSSTADTAAMKKTLKDNQLARRGNFGWRWWNRMMAFLESHALFHKTVWEMKTQKLLRKSNTPRHYALTTSGQQAAMRLKYS